MQKWKLDEILDLLKKAGRIALNEYTVAVSELKSDLSVVTVADKKIECFYATVFDRPGAGTFMIGEETVAEKSEEYLQQALHGICYVIDPIDGTAPYAAAIPLWGTSIGLMEQGVLTEGAFYMPFQDEAFITCRGTVWHARGLLGATPEISALEAKKAPLSPAFGISVSQKTAKSGVLTFPNQVFAWSSCVGSYYGLLTGRLLGCIHSSKLWDLAGGLPILKAAGYSCLYENAEEFDLTVTEKQFQLSPVDGRWRHKKVFVIAPTPEAVAYIWKHTQIPKEA